MPVLTAAPPPTVEQVKQMIDAAIAKFLTTAVPNYVDPKTGAKVSYGTAIRRGLTAYDYVAINGPMDKRVSVLEGLMKTDDLDDAAEAAEQDAIKAALQKPILP